MLGVPLKRFLPSDFDPKARINGTQLSTSKDFGVAVSLTEKCDKGQSCCIQIVGNPGSGRTTLAQAICSSLLDNNYCSVQQLLFIKVQRGSNENSMWNFFSELAKDRQEKDTASVLSLTSTKILKKLEALVELLQIHFKIVCLDDVDCDSFFLFKLLSSALLQASCKVIITSSEDVKNQGFSAWEMFHSVHLKGFTDTQLIRQSIKLSSFLDLSLLSRVIQILSGNPVAIKVFDSFVKEFSLSMEQVEEQISYLESNLQLNNQQHCNAVQLVLMLISNWLDQSDLITLLQLSQLRQPLPVTDFTHSLSKLEHLSLMDINQGVQMNDKIAYFVTLQNCIQRHFQDEFRKNRDYKVFCCKENEQFDVLQTWLSLLSKELQLLINDAEENAWPFVPEKWQYISDVGPEESYNIKELITSKNAVVTSMIELDVMQECIHHAVVMKRFSKLAALVFVMDRFMYWQEGSRTTMRLVDYLQANSPHTPIAPQLVIRKARVMKNNGDLQGAERTLDMLLTEKHAVGQWRYKDEDDHNLVSAVCIQIKGDIQYTLGQWVEGAGLLLDSISGFESLPKPDKKGLSASNGLLANCLQNMYLQEYLHLASRYNLVEGHPLLQAYKCCTEAANFSQFTPMFFSRHMCQAGAILLEYSKQLNDEKQRQVALQAVIQDLKASIQSHRTVSSLTSREEFFVFNYALFQLSLVLLDASFQGALAIGEMILSLSKILYEHYCSFGKVVLLDEKTTALIFLVLQLLGLEQFTSEEISGTVIKTTQAVNSLDLGNKDAFQNIPKKAGAVVSPSVTNQQEGSSDPQTSLPVTQGAYHQDARTIPSRNLYDAYWKSSVFQNSSVETTLSSLELVEQLKKGATADLADLKHVSTSKEKSNSSFEKGLLVTSDVELSIPGGGSHVANADSKITSSNSQASFEVIEKGAASGLGWDTSSALVDEDALNKNTTTSNFGVDKALDKNDAGSYSKAGWVLVDQEAATKDTVSLQTDVTQDLDKDAATKEATDSGSKTNWVLVDHKAVTMKASYDSNVCTEITNQREVANETGRFASEPRGPIVTTKTKSLVDQEAVTKETKEITILSTVDCPATIDNSIIAQELEEETAELPNKLLTSGMAHKSVASQLDAQFKEAERVHEAVAWKYDPIHKNWQSKTTLAFIGSPLELEKGKEGKQRDAYNVEYIDQDEPMGRYVAKRYKKPRGIYQYQQDIICQMTARHYVGLFNHELYQTGLQSGSIQFLPVALLQMTEKETGANVIYNVEPFMAGEFIKLTNNFDFANKSADGTDLVLAFCHFTYKASGGNLLVVDIQGWVPGDNKSCMFLTDPQIHSPVYKCFGTGNFGFLGFERFWSKMHPDCNAICKKLGLKRP